MAFLFSGIPGSNYLLIFGNAILIGLALLLYGGRRWRFLLQGLLVSFLVLPTFGGGKPFDMLARVPIIINSLHGDILFNSLYGFFKRRNKLKLWAIMMTTEFYLVSSLLNVLNFYLFSTPDVVTMYVNTIVFVFPVLIIESAAGACIGYKIYERTKTTGLVVGQ